MAALSSADMHLILQLRLLIARAANRDGLVWWDDDSLTEPAGFVLERLFPVAPPLAARSLSLAAARARHRGALGEIQGALHLFRLDEDNADGLAAREVRLLDVEYPHQPITTTEDLRAQLEALLGRPSEVKVVDRLLGGRLQIAVPPCPLGVWPPLHRARFLAWAYGEGAPAQPVFPFVVH